MCTYSKYPVGEICVDRYVQGTQACNRILLTLRLHAGYKYVYMCVSLESENKQMFIDKRKVKRVDKRIRMQ